MLISEIYKWHKCFKVRCKLVDGSVVWFKTVQRKATNHLDICPAIESGFSPYTKVWWEYRI